MHTKPAYFVTGFGDTGITCPYATSPATPSMRPLMPATPYTALHSVASLTGDIHSAISQFPLTTPIPPVTACMCHQHTWHTSIHDNFT